MELAVCPQRTQFRRRREDRHRRLGCRSISGSAVATSAIRQLHHPLMKRRLSLRSRRHRGRFFTADRRTPVMGARAFVMAVDHRFAAIRHREVRGVPAYVLSRLLATIHFIASIAGCASFPRTRCRVADRVAPRERSDRRAFAALLTGCHGRSVRARFLRVSACRLYMLLKVRSTAKLAVATRDRRQPGKTPARRS